MSDAWVLGFITIWVILCAGEPDLLDAITKRVAGQPCEVHQPIEEK